MKITEIISIPKFIQKYINNDEPCLESMTHDFCKLICELEFDSVNFSDNFLSADIKNNYSIKRFTSFYIDKLYMYNKELSLKNELVNDLFVGIIDDKLTSFFIYSLEEDKLTIIKVKKGV